MTSVNVQTNDLKDEPSITKEYIDNNAAVRIMFTERTYQGIYESTRAQLDAISGALAELQAASMNRDQERE